jgi:RNA polymerase sigma-70 factor (ECF subfamily)
MMPIHDPTPGSLAPEPAGRPGAASARPRRTAKPRTAPPRTHAAPGSVALEALLDAHGTEVYRHLRRLAPTAEDAADLHQETFLRALRALPALPADANHRAWLHRIAANAAADAHRRRTVRSAADPPLARDAAPRGEPGDADPADAIPTRDAAADPAARAEAAELRSAVRAALADLPWRERTAVVARVLEGRDYPDVADAIDCSEPNARQIVSRGIRRVRTALAPYLETDR